MPKNAALTTLISDGAPFNVTWHLGYPHQGGFKIELLDANDKFMTNLTSGWVDVDTTAQSHPITLPQNLSCKGCTVSICCCRRPLKEILGVCVFKCERKLSDSTAAQGQRVGKQVYILVMCGCEHS